MKIFALLASTALGSSFKSLRALFETLPPSIVRDVSTPGSSRVDSLVAFFESLSTNLSVCSSDSGACSPALSDSQIEQLTDEVVDVIEDVMADTEEVATEATLSDNLIDLSEVSINQPDIHGMHEALAISPDVISNVAVSTEASEIEPVVPQTEDVSEPAADKTQVSLADATVKSAQSIVPAPKSSNTPMTRYENQVAPAMKRKLRADPMIHMILQ